MRQEETEGKTGGSRETKRREKPAAERKGTEWGDLLLPLSPTDSTQGSESTAAEGGCRERGKGEAP